MRCARFSPIRPRTLLLVLLVSIAPALSGCSQIADWFGGCGDGVRRTVLDEDGWNRDNRFVVELERTTPAQVTIKAIPVAGGDPVRVSGLAGGNDTVGLTIPDGTWDVSYDVDGTHCETFHHVRVDATAPEPTGLETVGDAQDGAYTIGASAVVPSDATVTVRDLETGAVLAHALPVEVTGLKPGRHAYEVALQDPAGNLFTRIVQVRAGDARFLPDGQYTFGVVARYENGLRLWDLEHMEAFLTPAQARSATGGAYLGSGYAITPDADAVQAIVDAEVDPSMTTAQAALALYKWLFDHLEYDEERLEANDLLTPAQTLDQGGGVCRDLAALYVSLLRGAGIPARLVSGYLAGTVDGFHAWVEFYGGDAGGEDPWIPVDVSPIDGPYDPVVAAQAFGILVPEYLPLRKIPEDSEVEGWSTALSVAYGYHGQEPEVDFVKTVTPTGLDETGVLCLDPDRFARHAVRANTADEAQQKCRAAGDYPLLVGISSGTPSFLLFSERVIDYGVQVDSAHPGDTFDVGVAIPYEDAASPNRVEQQPYGDPDLVTGWEEDRTAGVYTTHFQV